MPRPPHDTVAFAEIAGWLNFSVGRVAAFAAERERASPAPKQYRDGVPASEVGAFVRDLARAEGLDPKAYDVPETMHRSPHPWERMVAAMYGHPCAYPACLSPSQGRQLREIVLERKPREILEIGCFMGVSSLWIASALEEIGGEGRLHSIDLFEPILPWPPHRYGYLGKPEVLARTAAYVAGLDHRIRFHRMNSFDLADRYGGMIDRPVDFAFIDGDHTVEGCLHDVMTIAPHVETGGALLLHDTNPAFCGWDGPRYVLDRYLIPSPYFRVTEIETEPWNFGMAMIEKLEEVPSPDFGWRLRMFRTRWRSRLVRTPLWQSVRGTPLGKLVLDAVRR